MSGSDGRYRGAKLHSGTKRITHTTSELPFYPADAYLPGAEDTVTLYEIADSEMLATNMRQRRWLELTAMALTMFSGASSQNVLDSAVEIFLPGLRVHQKLFVNLVLLFAFLFLVLLIFRILSKYYRQDDKQVLQWKQERAIEREKLISVERRMRRVDLMVAEIMAILQIREGTKKQKQPPHVTAQNLWTMRAVPVEEDAETTPVDPGREADLTLRKRRPYNSRTYDDEER